MNVGFFHNTAYYLHLHYGQMIEHFVRRHHIVTVFTPGDPAVQELQALGAVHVPVTLSRRGQNPFAELFALRKIYNSIRRQQLDVLFNYSIKPVIYGSLAARLCNIENVFSTITGRGYVFGDATLRQKLLRAVVLTAYRQALRVNKCVFFQNSEDRDYFVQQKLVSQQRTFVTKGTGIDLQAYQPAPYQSHPETFLLIARLLKEKGVHEFVSAARSLKQEFPNARFLLAGPLDDNPTAISREELDSWSNEGVIEYLGVLADVREALGRASVFVLPSYYREGLPRVNLEALAMGKPIITTDWPGCRETVVDEVNGLLVAVRDADQLAAAMKRLLADPALGTTMGAASRRLAEERYDVVKVTESVLGQVRKSLGDPEDV